MKHYKERHPNSPLPEALAELDRVVTIGMSKTIPPEERGLAASASFYDSNDSSYLAEEQMNKTTMVSILKKKRRKGVWSYVYVTKMDSIHEKCNGQG